MAFRLKIMAAGLLIGSLVASCKPDDSDGDGLADARDRCPSEAGVKPSGCPVRKELRAVRFFLETSASMGGYFRGAAEFPVVVSDLVMKIDRTLKPVAIFFIADSVEKFRGTPQDFSGAIAATSITFQKSSQLHKIIAEVARRTDSQDVSLFVSDCILSFPDSAVKRSPEINRDYAPSTLKTGIYSTFADLNRKKNFGASVYAFHSKFKGTYYDYHNKPHTLKGDERPFYIWAIGDKALLARFNTQLAEIPSFRPEQELHFGLSDSPVTAFRIIPGISRQGNWMKSGRGIDDLGNAAKNPAQFCVGLDLSRLPPYAQQPAYLREHLQLEPHGCTVSLTVLKAGEADRSRLRSDGQKADLEASTHVLLVKVTGMATQRASLVVRLPLRYDRWYEAWSCMNDADLATDCAGKTFAFQYLIDGVREAYETRNADFLRIALDLHQ